MASWLAKAAFRSKVSSLTGSGSSSAAASSTAGGVKWDDLNYLPWHPALHVLHYSPATDSIPERARSISRLCHTCLKLVVALHCFNFCACIVLAACGAAPAIDLFSSLVRLAVCGGVQTVTFYQGYRSVAGELRQAKLLYSALQSAVAVWLLLCACVASGSIHGLAGCAQASRQSAYQVVCGVEGAAHLLLLCCVAWCVYCVWTYPGHAIAQRYEAQPLQTESPQKLKGGGGGKHAANKHADKHSAGHGAGSSGSSKQSGASGGKLAKGSKQVVDDDGI